MGRMSPIIGHLLVFVVVGLVFCFPFGIMKPFTILCFLALLSIGSLLFVGTLFLY